jgi:hypothetical protein
MHGTIPNNQAIGSVSVFVRLSLLATPWSDVHRHRKKRLTVSPEFGPRLGATKSLGIGVYGSIVAASPTVHCQGIYFCFRNKPSPSEYFNTASKMGALMKFGVIATSGRRILVFTRPDKVVSPLGCPRACTSSVARNKQINRSIRFVCLVLRTFRSCMGSNAS